jgi:O-antigen/teichoic acid export membrane protein
MNNKSIKSPLLLLKNTVFRNSSWGIISQVAQTVLVSLFFIILARKYSTNEFSKYIIATVLYQLITAFSGMGLNLWFIREIAATNDKKDLVTKFLKIQIYFGVLFYLVNICFSYLLYEDQFIRVLSVLIGINIIFDNVIDAIKSLNIADFQQKKTFVILTIEAILKFLTGCLLFIYPLPIVILSVILITIRFISLNLFIKFGSSALINLKTLWTYKISFTDTRYLVFLNWPFIIISGVSIINWRMANILISKILSITEVANYEISYKVFSIAQILPIIVVSTVFPILNKFYMENDVKRFSAFYRKIHLYYMLFGLLAYTFIYSFADLLLPMAFGSKYLLAASYTKQMFLTILIFPTAFLHANIIIAMKLEKKDMIFNIVMMCINVSTCFLGLHYLKSLSAANYSIFISFLIFHMLQDGLLIRRKITSLKQTILFYLITAVFISIYILLTRYINTYFLFLIYWAFTLCILLSAKKIKHIIKKLFSKEVMPKINQANI